MSYLRDFYEVLVRCEQAPPPFDQWSAFYADNAELWPLTDDQGKLYGGVLFKGQQVHLAVDPDWHGRWISKKLYRAYETWANPGDVTATIPKDNAQAIELARRLGLEHRGSQNGFEIYVKPGTPAAT